MNHVKAKDLTKEAPRSPHEKLGGFSVVARTIDKCRAHIAGTPGEYHFDCPVDNMLFGWKGLKGADFRKFVETGVTDDEIVAWVKENGLPKTDVEIAAWSKKVDGARYHGDPQKGEWFDGECKRLGIDPAENTLFQMLDEDDKQSFKK